MKRSLITEPERREESKEEAKSGIGQSAGSSAAREETLGWGVWRRRQRYHVVVIIPNPLGCFSWLARVKKTASTLVVVFPCSHQWMSKVYHIPHVLYPCEKVSALDTAPANRLYGASQSGVTKKSTRRPPIPLLRGKQTNAFHGRWLRSARGSHSLLELASHTALYALYHDSSDSSKITHRPSLLDGWAWNDWSQGLPSRMDETASQLLRRFWWRVAWTSFNPHFSLLMEPHYLFSFGRLSDTLSDYETSSITNNSQREIAITRLGLLASHKKQATKEV